MGEGSDGSDGSNGIDGRRVAGEEDSGIHCRQKSVKFVDNLRLGLPVDPGFIPVDSGFIPANPHLPSRPRTPAPLDSPTNRVYIPSGKP